jgi:predicted phage terminase large subunit-like protein
MPRPLEIPNEKFIPLFAPARTPTLTTGGKAVIARDHKTVCYTDGKPADRLWAIRAVEDAEYRAGLYQTDAGWFEGGTPVPLDLIAEAGHARTRYYVYYGGRGGAKCLGRGTQVVMLDGSLRAVEDVREGEQLLGVDGTPRTVLSTTQGRSKLFRVRQKSGEDYIVNEDHVLALTRSKAAREDFGHFSSAGNPQRANGRYAKWGDDPSLISARDFAGKSKRFRANFFGFKGEGFFSEKELPLDPYFLGLWLGDGDSVRAAVTSADQEIADYLTEFAESQGMRVESSRKPGGKAAIYRIVSRKGDKQVNEVNRKLRGLGVLGSKSLPFEYRTGSGDQRLRLLAGMVDSDGHVRHNGIKIVQKNGELLRQVKFVADSLGFKTNFRRADATCTNNGKVCEAWSLSIDGDVWRIPCKVARKRVVEGGKNKDWRRGGIDLEDLGEGDYFGFELDGDHLFFLEDFTVTHNSHQFAVAAVMRAMQEKITILCCRQIQSSMADSVLKVIADKIDVLGLSDHFEVLVNAIRCKLTGSEFAFRGLHNIQDIKSFEGAKICWVEEAVSVTEDSWDTLEPTIRASGSEMWLSFNTGMEDDYTYRNYVGGADYDTTLVEVSYLDNPLLSAEALVQAEKMRINNPGKYEHIWGGKPRRAREGGVFTSNKVSIIDAAPADLTEVRGWDFAGTEFDPEKPGREPDWTVGARMGRTQGGRFVVTGMVRMRGKPHEVEELLVRTAGNDGFGVEQDIPQDPGQAGKHQVQYFVSKMAGMRVRTSTESGDKVTRAEPFASQVNVGNVDFVRGAWNDAALKELDGFPNETHDDIVDAMGRAFRRLLEPRETQMLKVMGL